MSLFSGQTNAAGKTVASGVKINSSCYGSVVPLAYGTTRASGNLIWYGDFAATKAGSGKGGKNGGDQYNYSAYFAFGLCEGTIGGIVNIWADGTIFNWAYCTANGIGLMTGAQGQSPWGYLTTKHPGQDLGYSGTAYVYWQPGQLGSSAQLQNFAFEIQGIGNGVYGTPDADPEYVVTDMLTNPAYGVGFPPARLGDVSVFSNYCRASGMVISLLLDSQQDAASTLNDVVQQCNSEFVWSGAQLTIVPYGDQNLSANGASYTAPSVALYSLGDDDFIETGTGDPVQLSRARPSDRMNSVKLEWLNRSNQYAAEIVEAKDQAAIETWGLRSDQPKQSHQFTTLSAATMSATLQLQRQAVRNQYSFTLGWKYCLLDPMDIVEITDANLGLVQQWVRILSIEEDDNGNLKVTAEEYLGGTGGAPLYSFQSGNPYIGNLNAPPGAVNAPVILEPPIGLLGGDPELVIGVSGSSPYWGSADIYMSTDGGTTYELIGRATKGASLGVTTAALPVHADPDTTDLLTLDISQSYGATLTPATHGTADNFQTSLWICNSDYSDGELVGYGIETLTGTGTYKLSDSGGGSIYLRRGQLGTVAALHASGSMVLAMDKNVFTMDLPASLSGVTLYFKFVSLNLYGGAPTDLSSATAYSFTPVVSGGSTGFGGPVGVPGPLTATPAYAIQNDGTVLSGMDLSWTPTTDTNCTSQELQWKPHSGSTWISIMVSATADYYFLQGLQANLAYDFQVRSVRVGVGTVATQYSAFEQALNVAAAFPPAPAALSAPTVVAGPTSVVPAGCIGIYWAASSSQNIAGYDVAYNTSNTLTGATLVSPRPGPLDVPTATNPLIIALAPATYYCFVRVVDTLGQIATWSSSGSTTLAAVGAPGALSLSAGFDTQADGTLQPYLEGDWIASSDPLFDGYEIQWQIRGAGTWTNDKIVPAAALSWKVQPIVAGQAYDMRVRALRHTTQGAFSSAWVETDNQTVPTKGTGPAVPTGLVTGVGVRGVLLSWSANSLSTDPDFDHYQVWASGTNNSSGAVLVADQVKTTAFFYNGAGSPLPLVPGSNYTPTFYFWIKAVNTSGVASGFSGGSGATGVSGYGTTASNVPNYTIGSFTGSSAQVQILNGSTGETLTFGKDSIVFVNVNVGQGYTGSTGTWGLWIQWDGAYVAVAGNIFVATAQNIAPSLTVAISVADSSYPSSHRLNVQWQGQGSNMSLTGGTVQVVTVQQ